MTPKPMIILLLLLSSAVCIGKTRRTRTLEVYANGAKHLDRNITAERKGKNVWVGYSGLDEYDMTFSRYESFVDPRREIRMVCVGGMSLSINAPMTICVKVVTSKKKVRP